MAPFRKSLAALVIGLAVSPAVLPLGFGDLQLQSQLNQPLQAEIPILGVPAYASDAIRIRLGKREDFSALGYDYTPEMDDIRAELQQRDNRLVLQLRSRNALREPLLNIVLVAEDGSTRYLRDYAILLDLPGNPSAEPSPVLASGTSSISAAIAEQARAPVPAARTDAAIAETVRAETVKAETAATVTRANEVATPVADSSPAVSVVTTPRQSATNAPATNSINETLYGPTRPGESLSTIAHRIGKARGAEWHAFGVALYHANPEAFIAGDPNRLKMAMPLRLPTATDVQRYQRGDWVALFADTPTRAAKPVASNEAVPTAVSPASTAASTTSAVTATSAAANTTPSVDLRGLQQENQQLKTDLQAASARMQALEEQLNKLDARYTELTRPVPVTSSDSAPSSSTESTTTAPVAQTTSAAPVTVEIRDTLAATTAANNANPSTAQTNASISTPVKGGWQGAVLSLLIVLALTVAGVLFWQWSERRQSILPTRKPRAPRVPRPVLPLAEADEPVPVVDNGSPDRRMLKLKQVQAALETYLTYQRFDRGLELVEQEMHAAGDDLLLRRHLQRLQKQIKQEQLAWQREHSEQLSEQFDRATTTHVDKPTSRDETKKTSG